MNFLGFPSYLETGPTTQRLAHAALVQANIFTLLAEFHPALAGTLPLAIDIPGSDLDILCEVYDFASFAALIQHHYAHLPDFYQNEKHLNDIPSHVSRFTWELIETGGNPTERATPHEIRFPIEIVAQPIPVREQRAFRHLRAEAHLLEQGGDPARAAIRALKLFGIKTEPAFGQYFGLVGDPYQILLEQVE